MPRVEKAELERVGTTGRGLAMPQERRKSRSKGAGKAQPGFRKLGEARCV